MERGCEFWPLAETREERQKAAWGTRRTSTKQQVLGFQVSVHQVHIVQSRYRLEHYFNDVARLLLRVRSFGHDAIKQLAPFDKLGDKKHIGPLVKVLVKLDDVLVVDSR